ncbi:WYL domain-containing protein [Melissospora conviva]|uniref:WYL domain-containing protein n=1 Tax=Melissospora conviva TaxID=3388432 RepID=UPI003C19F722
MTAPAPPRCRLSPTTTTLGAAEQRHLSPHHRRSALYRRNEGRGNTLRSVEPHTLANFGRHWYLVARDLGRTDWRTFRVDRLTPRTPNGPRVALRCRLATQPTGSTRS